VLLACSAYSSALKREAVLGSEASIPDYPTSYPRRLYSTKISFINCSDQINYFAWLSYKYYSTFLRKYSVTFAISTDMW
jgi:hypothetical protein